MPAAGRTARASASATTRPGTGGFSAGSGGAALVAFEATGACHAAFVQLTGRTLADKTYVVNCDLSSCYDGDKRTIGLSLTAAF